MANNPNKIRIIGGKWRGRKLKFVPITGLRPTPNRLRETLFNWLAPVIEGAICLDLFAGSGALGFEALSRGATHVVMVDKSPQVIRTLKENAKILGAENIEFICAEFSPNLLLSSRIISTSSRGLTAGSRANNYSPLHGQIHGSAPTDSRAFDIVFLDPPFHQNLIKPCLDWLEKNKCLSPDAFVYIETEKSLDISAFTPHWDIYRSQTAGDVSGSLLQISDSSK